MILGQIGADKLTSLHRDVLELSAFYHTHPGKPTPWKMRFTERAYLSYFLPLNYARLSVVFVELKRHIQPDSISEIWDFGSGPGTTQWVLEDQEWLAPHPFHCVESSPEAIRLHEKLAVARGGHWKPQFGSKRAPSKGALAIFSYSFLEMRPSKEIENFDHILIVEPSTRECGRSLMEWRQTFLERGYGILAPCTHFQLCPLLQHSPRDWCHMRINFEGPEWFQKLEEHLPMKNRTLTYSYLLLSRYAKAQGGARVIGDTLEERGKTRQMICRGPDREFLSWLHRYGEAPRIPHGALIETGLETCEPKGGELRLPPSAILKLK